MTTSILEFSSILKQKETYLVDHLNAFSLENLRSVHFLVDNLAKFMKIESSLTKGCPRYFKLVSSDQLQYHGTY